MMSISLLKRFKYHSFRTPRHDKLLELRDMMRKLGLHPTIHHEYVEEKNKDRNYYHSYFSVELEVDNDE